MILKALPFLIISESLEHLLSCHILWQRCIKVILRNILLFFLNLKNLLIFFNFLVFINCKFMFFLLWNLLSGITLITVFALKQIAFRIAIISFFHPYQIHVPISSLSILFLNLWLIFYFIRRFSILLIWLLLFDWFKYLQFILNKFKRVCHVKRSFVMLVPKKGLISLFFFIRLIVLLVVGVKNEFLKLIESFLLSLFRIFVLLIFYCSFYRLGQKLRC